MFTKKALFSSLLIAGMIGTVSLPLPSIAATSVNIDVHIAPPPPRYEAVPAARAGYVWSPGHWQWRGGRHVWVPGHWERVRAGYVYRTPRWAERGGRWYYEAPRWDRDGDGIPNRADPTPRGGGVIAAPPPPRYEVVPGARAGYVWSAGHWQWRGGQYVWIAGHWERARVGYRYYAPRWVERGGRWYYETPRWDRDGDGIPNRRDPTPNTSRPGDRDGDGVPNRRDARPDNPYR
jgi:hypothetical protein